MSKQSNHTAGPWVIGMRNGANGRTIFARNGEKHPEATAETVAHYDEGICDVYGLYLNTEFANQPDGEPLANARLIAAAPDVLQSLEEVMAYVETGAYPAGMEKRARCAIAKARGK